MGRRQQHPRGFRISLVTARSWARPGSSGPGSQSKASPARRQAAARPAGRRAKEKLQNSSCISLKGVYLSYVPARPKVSKLNLRNVAHHRHHCVTVALYLKPPIGKVLRAVLSLA